MVFKKKDASEKEDKPKKLDYKKLIEEGKVYVIENRHLKRADSEIAENLQDARHYRLECDGMYIFDFDRYLAAPQMRDILAKMGQYLETKLIKWALVLIGVVLLLQMLFFVRLPSKGYVDEAISKINVQQASQNATPVQTQPKKLEDLIP